LDFTFQHIPNTIHCSFLHSNIFQQSTKLRLDRSGWLKNSGRRPGFHGSSGQLQPAAICLAKDEAPAGGLRDRMSSFVDG